MITPAFRFVPLLVKGDIPYLDINDIEKFKNATDMELFAVTGVYIDREKGTVAFRLPTLPAKSKKKKTASPAVLETDPPPEVELPMSLTTFNDSSMQTDIVLSTADLEPTNPFRVQEAPECGICGIDDHPDDTVPVAASQQDKDGSDDEGS